MANPLFFCLWAFYGRLSVDMPIIEEERQDKRKMGNMSYCRFRNTLNDLRECYEHIANEDLSDEESEARKKLIELCKDIAS